MGLGQIFWLTTKAKKCGGFQLTEYTKNVENEVVRREKFYISELSGQPPRYKITTQNTPDMRQYLILLFVVFSLLSCSRDDEAYPENPKWLEDKITQMAGSAMPGIEVVAYKWNNMYFYHIMNPVSSCMYCDFYDYSGTKMVWSDDDFADFITYGEKVRVVWKKGY